MDVIVMPDPSSSRPQLPVRQISVEEVFVAASRFMGVKHACES
jgi:hypothetical protein